MSLFFEDDTQHSALAENYFSFYDLDRAANTLYLPLEHNWLDPSPQLDETSSMDWLYLLNPISDAQGWPDNSNDLDISTPPLLTVNTAQSKQSQTSKQHPYTETEPSSSPLTTDFDPNAFINWDAFSSPDRKPTSLPHPDLVPTPNFTQAANKTNDLPKIRSRPAAAAPKLLLKIPRRAKMQHPPPSELIPDFDNHFAQSSTVSVSTPSPSQPSLARRSCSALNISSPSPTLIIPRPTFARRSPILASEIPQSRCADSAHRGYARKYAPRSARKDDGMGRVAHNSTSSQDRSARDTMTLITAHDM